MIAESWSRVDKLFQSAVELDPAGRAVFLDEACAGNTKLRIEVESLLTIDSRDWDLLERSALESAVDLLADEQPRLKDGEVIGHYEILGLIRKGGMGEVYLARDAILNRNIALKLLPLDYTQDPHRLQRFQREAQTVSALNHPNIITIYEFGSVNDQQFIATEFIEGETLRQQIALGPMPVSETLEIAIQVVGALAAAHRAGIVHRDIKPENIMLRPDGYVKVLDFGLAKLMEQSEPQSRPGGVERIDVSSGVLMGTLRYMSPEQLSGLPVDARSDIFSLGAVIYEMLMGRRPFDDKYYAQPAESMVKNEPVVWSRTGSESFLRIVSKMLSKDPNLRYKNADELLVELKSLRSELNFEGSGSKNGVYRNRRRPSDSKALSSAVRRIGLPAFAIILLVVVSIISAIGYKIIRSSSAGSSGGRWETKAPLSSPRWQAEPAVLNDTLYVAGGWNVCTPFADLESYDPVNDTWTQRAPMHTARGGHGVAVLNGQLYAIGGSTDCHIHTSSVEAYDPGSNSWSEKAPLPTSLFSHTVASANGKIYATGGHVASNSNCLRSNFEYDPQTNTWRERAPMPTARSRAASAVIDGIIYVIGGAEDSGASLATVEAYDPVTDTWTQKKSMLFPRSNLAVAESEGIIYAFGGNGSREQVEAYDPATDSWRIVGTLPTRGSHFHAATLRGSIYLAGGFDGFRYLSSVVTFTPDSNFASKAACPTLKATAKASMPSKRTGMTVGGINGILYAVGGFENTSRYLELNEAYDPAADKWTAKSPMPSARETRGINTAVADGKLFVIGGNANGTCSSLNEAYDPATDSWIRRAPMPTPRCHLATVVVDGLIYALGGTNTNGSIEYSTVEVYDPSNDTWTTAPPMPTGRQDLGAVSLNGILYAFGGGNPALYSTGEVNIVEAYDPIEKKWTSKAPMPIARSAMAGGVLNGMIVVAGGFSSETSLAVVDVYDPASDIWTTVTSLPQARSFASAVTMNDTLYMLSGNGPTETQGSVGTVYALNLIPCPDQK